MGLLLHVHVYRQGQLLGEHVFDSDTQRTIKIGRLPSAQLTLDDPQAARIHAVIEIGAREASLVDMGSLLGTALNGRSVQKAVLSHGDAVQVGNTRLMIGVGAPAVASGGAPAGASGSERVASGANAAGVHAPVAAATRIDASGVHAPVAAVTGVDASGAHPSVAVVSGIEAAGGAPAAASAVAAPGGVAARFNAQHVTSALQRLTSQRLNQAAVESRPHPSLPSEEPITEANRVLELRLYWGDVLLGINHFFRTPRITIGESKRTDVFIASDGLPVDEFPLVRFQDGEYVLLFSEGMEGEVAIAGQLHSLSTLRQGTLASPDGELDKTHRIALPLDARAIVHWGGATLAMRFVPPTAAVPRSLMQSLDLPYLNTLLVSGFLHIVVVVLMLVYPYDTAALRVDIFSSDANRFANLILEPPKETKTTKAMLTRIRKKVEEEKKLRKPPAERRHKRTASRAAAKEGAKNTDKGATTPSADAKRREIAQKFSSLFRGSGDGGNLLGGGGGGSLSGELANVIGTTGAASTTGGLAGLNIRGDGPLTGGGAGTSVGVAGIDTAGRLGGGGTGYGSQVGMGDKQERDMISLTTPVVLGALPAEAIKKVINQNKNQIRYCYEFELQRHPQLEGRVVMTWVIGASGSVVKASVKESSLKNTNVERCLIEKIKTWQFPAPAGGGIVEVNYPFVFKSG